MGNQPTPPLGAALRAGRPRLWRGLAWVGLVALLPGCASSSGSKSAAAKAPPAAYVRVVYPDADTVEFQIAVREFMPRRGPGPAIWLAGASHVGEPAYYAALQRHLDAQGLVLFEGIKDLGEDAPPPAPAEQRPAPALPPRETTPVAEPDSASLLQVNLAKSLGLVFQLEALAYDRAHFRNSDLSAGQLQALMRAGQRNTRRGGTESDRTEFESLVQTMQGTSLFGAALNTVLGWIGSSPHLQALTRLALIEVLGQLDGDLAQMQGLPPEFERLLAVLIQERNKAVVADLKAALKGQPAPRSISVLYGVGHLPDLEQRLRRELKYRPADQLWLPVFSINTQRAGLSDWEISLVRLVVRSQLQGLQKPSGRPAR